jgi:hypothetical protein
MEHVLQSWVIALRRREVRAGCLAADAVDAVLAATGQRAKRRVGLAGLTPASSRS